jgi:hypothetical protein
MAKGDDRAFQDAQCQITIEATDDSNYYSEEDISTLGEFQNDSPFSQEEDDHQLIDIQPSDLMYRGEGNSSLVMALVHVSS